MNKFFKISLLILLFLASFALLAMYISKHEIAVLNSKGWVGSKESDLIITSSLIMLIVVIPVFVMTLIFAWKYRENNTKSKHMPDWEHSYLAECCWWGGPLIIIIILAVMTWKSSHELNPSKPLQSDKKPLHIQVIALQWKWLFLYPELGIATINFVQFPEKIPINFEITSDAPMNSFWIPQLGGQIYAMPAMRSKLHLIADEIGDFRGVSANISGVGFSRMTFTARSSLPEDFANWVKSVRSSSKELTWDEYEQLLNPTTDNPLTTYLLPQNDLFDRVIMKYMTPQ